MPEITDIAALEALLDECQTTLKYQFRDRELLVVCLTHSSSARTRLHSNERLEFFGDAILGTVVCEALFDRFPESDEGELTRIKSIVVSRVTCAIMAEQVQLEQFVLVGKGLGVSGRIPSSIVAGAFESLIAGIYLDGGLEAIRSFLLPLLSPEIENAAATLHAQNYKSLLQHVAQKTLGATPQYRVLDERGPDHSKCFHVSAVVAGRSFPAAWGQNKKEAEQLAAQYALQELAALESGQIQQELPKENVTSASVGEEPLQETTSFETAATLPESVDVANVPLEFESENVAGVFTTVEQATSNSPTSLVASERNVDATEDDAGIIWPTT
ncbi:MAG: ribonuclease III [Planctomycetia bacterium]|nr:ribonuclease III [Planctomycetia bacterium]